MAEDEVVCEIETDKVKLNSCYTLYYSVSFSLMTNDLLEIFHFLKCCAGGQP